MILWNGLQIPTYLLKVCTILKLAVISTCIRMLNQNLHISIRTPAKVIIIICSFCNAWLPTHWVLKALLCDSCSPLIGYYTSGRQASFVHTMRDQKLWTRNMKGYRFLGVGGNRSARKNLPRRVWNRQTKFTYNHWLAALVNGKCLSTNQPASPLE